MPTQEENKKDLKQSNFIPQGTKTKQKQRTTTQKKKKKPAF